MNRFFAAFENLVEDSQNDERLRVQFKNVAAEFAQKQKAEKVGKWPPLPAALGRFSNARGLFYASIVRREKSHPAVQCVSGFFGGRSAASAPAFWMRRFRIPPRIWQK